MANAWTNATRSEALHFGAGQPLDTEREEAVMAYLGASAFPVVPGQEERVRNFGQEVALHQEEFDRLNREAGGWKHFAVFLQESPMGNLAIMTWELEDPTKVRQAFTDSPYDNWWLDYLRDVLGIDIRNWPSDQPPPSPPPQGFEWRA
jgi:hypothetical protein